MRTIRYRNHLLRFELIIFGALAAASPVQATCVRPSAGLSAERRLEVMPSNSVASVKWDAQLRKRVMLVPVCGHPEWPLQVVPMEGDMGLNAGGAPLVDVQPLVVRAGEVVRLWRREEDLRIEVTGIAQASGCIGTRIKVKVVRGGAAAQDAAAEISGVVRGVGDVEMER